jgi:hypothetical protein
MRGRASSTPFLPWCRTKGVLKTTEFDSSFERRREVGRAEWIRAKFVNASKIKRLDAGANVRSRLSRPVLSQLLRGNDSFQTTTSAKVCIRIACGF